jgi:ubiquinone/menaquinone biosynthesis C-methylase UbiE
MTKLPYFDFLFERLKTQDIFKQAFSDHVHWGLFEKESPGRVTIDEYIVASENLSRRIISLSALADGMRVLDVGCGFGGTARMIGQQFSEVTVTGLNIDPRQIERARSLTNNQNVDFVEGSACAIPFPDGTFDRLLAVESIFHFESRLKFLKEVQRVLKPSGLLVISDFVLNGASILSVAVRSMFERDPMQRFYGRVNATTLSGYRILAALSRLKFVAALDVTEQTLPTYTFLKQIAVESDEVGTPPDLANRFMESISRKGQLKYTLLTFQAPAKS